MTVTTGVQRLDAMLEGGLRGGDRLLVHGPGREMAGLAREAMLANMAHGTPSVAVLTHTSVDDVRHQLRRAHSGYDEAEQDLAWFLDAYSRSVGLDAGAPRVAYVDSPLDLDGIRLAMEQLLAQVGHHDELLLVLDSASTLVLYNNARATTLFLQDLLDRACTAGAASLVLLDRGMHSEAEVEMFRRLVDGVLELREQDAPRLRTEGSESRFGGRAGHDGQELAGGAGPLAPGRVTG